MSWLLPAARFCFWLTKPDPPIVRKAKTVYRETRAWSELVNTVLPDHLHRLRRPIMILHELLWHHAKKHARTGLIYLAEHHPVIGGALAITGIAAVIHVASGAKTPAPTPPPIK